MTRISEFAGLIAGVALLLGALIAAQAYVSRDKQEIHAGLLYVPD